MLRLRGCQEMIKKEKKEKKKRNDENNENNEKRIFALTGVLAKVLKMKATGKPESP